MKSWREALPLAREVYEQPDAGCVGCCLHIVLDDGNIEDGHVDCCIEYATGRGHSVCLRVAQAIRGMTRTQRGQLVTRYEEYAR